MDGGPHPLGETARAASPRAGTRDPWIEWRLGYLAAEQARLKAGVPLRRFLRGAAAAYRRFLFTADPAHRFHCWVTIRTVSAGLNQLEGGELVMKSPDSHRMARTLDRHWRQA